MTTDNLGSVIFDKLEYESDLPTITKNRVCFDCLIDEINIKLDQINLDIKNEDTEIEGYKPYEAGYESALHYILLQPLESGFSYLTDGFLRFLTNKELGLLDIALSDKTMRKAFHEQAGYYYCYYNMSCEGELDMLVNRQIQITRLALDFTITSGQ